MIYNNESNELFILIKNIGYKIESKYNKLKEENLKLKEENLKLKEENLKLKNKI